MYKHMRSELFGVAFFCITFHMACAQPANWELTSSAGIYLVELFVPVGISSALDIHASEHFGIRFHAGLGGVILYNSQSQPLTVSSQIDIRTSRDSTHAMYGFAGVSFSKILTSLHGVGGSGYTYHGERWGKNLYFLIGCGFRPRTTFYEWSIHIPFQSNIDNSSSMDRSNTSTRFYLIFQFNFGIVI
jgi:hypothetical protein